MHAPLAAPLPEPAKARRKRALVADLFCGAGSLSMGANDALLALGYAPQFVAVNHWDVATRTYALNHPGSRVHCVTLDAAFPAALVPEGRLDLLMAGIECTYFSRARGGKPVNDQQRMSAWHVVRWCTELRVKRLAGEVGMEARIDNDHKLTITSSADQRCRLWNLNRRCICAGKATHQ